MNHKFLFATVMALSFAATGAADAKHKRHHAPRYYSAPVYMPVAPYAARTPGPVWAGPNECFTDEGYGRYWPCGAGRR